jgi:hypothetical protein
MTNEEMKNFLFVSIISADNDEFGLSEDDKQEIMRRYKIDKDWKYILEPIEDEKVRNTLVSFFNKE